MALTTATNFITSPQGQALLSMLAREMSGAINPQAVGRFLAARLPGKKNKAKRNAIKRQVLGNGRATTSAPVAYNVPVRKTAPRFRAAEGKYVVSNREFIAEVTGNTVFSVAEYTTQPGLASSFPWLSQIANTHQRYHIRKLVFTYVPLAATSERGRVILAFAIDPLDETPATKSELFQYPTSTESSVWASNQLVVNPMSRNDTLFTRAGAVADTDLKTYDLGKLFVGASNTADNTSKIGEIFVDYEVELSVPKPAHCPASLTIININLAAQIFGTSNGTSVVLTGSNIVGEHDSDGNDYLHFLAPGIYLINILMSAGTPGTLTSDDTELEGSIAELHSNVSSSLRQVTWRVTVAANSRVKLVLSGWTNPSLFKIATAMFTQDFTTVTVA